MPLPFLEPARKKYTLEKKNWQNPATALKDATRRSEFVGIFWKVEMTQLKLMDPTSPEQFTSVLEKKRFLMSGFMSGVYFLLRAKSISPAEGPFPPFNKSCGQ